MRMLVASRVLSLRCVRPSRSIGENACCKQSIKYDVCASHFGPAACQQVFGSFGACAGACAGAVRAAHSLRVLCDFLWVALITNDLLGFPLISVEFHRVPVFSKKRNDCVYVPWFLLMLLDFRRCYLVSFDVIWFLNILWCPLVPWLSLHVIWCLLVFF